MGNKYKTAVIGCGRIGSEFDDDPKRDYIASHAGAYSSIEESILMAVCDKDENKMKKCADRWNVPKRYQDHKRMLEEESD